MIGLICTIGLILFMVVMIIVGLSVIDKAIFKPLGDAGDEVAKLAANEIRSLFRHSRRR
jgi:hypothetical protein